MRETTYTVAIVIGEPDCVTSGHALLEVRHGLVCEDCSKVAARAAREGIDPETAVEAFRRSSSGEAGRSR